MSLKAASILCPNTAETFASLGLILYICRNKQSSIGVSDVLESSLDPHPPTTPACLSLSSESSRYPIWMFYSSPALKHPILRSHRGLSSWRGCFRYENTPIGRQAPLSDITRCSHMGMKSVFSPCCHNCLHVYVLISFSSPKMHLYKPIWLIVEPKSPNYLLSPPYTVNMVARVFDSQTNTQMMWLKVKQQSDWKEV